MVGLQVSASSKGFEMSEYGGNEHIIQPDIGDGLLPDEAEAAGLGHAAVEGRAADNKGVRDADMTVRYAGLKEAKGEVYETIIDEETGVASFVQYDEELARQELVRGENNR